MNDEKKKDAARAKAFLGPKLPNPVLNEDALKKFWADKIKITNKTVKVTK